MKKENILNKNKQSILSFVITSFIIMFFYLMNEIAPFGNKTILTMDLYHQYSVFLVSISENIKNSQSLFYSFGSGLGSMFLGNIINYCLSPFNIIVLFMGKALINESIAIIILLKSALAALTFTYATTKILDTNHKNSLLFGIMYALSAFFIAYYWNIMWFDAIYMLPIVVLGIYKLIKENKIGLYIFALTYSIITNYYMGYMLCIASVIAFLYLYFINNTLEDKKLLLKTSGKFIVASLICGLLSSVVLLPMVAVLKNTSTLNQDNIQFSFYFPFINFITNHFGLLSTSTRNFKGISVVLPNIYCGILTLCLVPLYFCNKQITKKEKILSTSLILFFFLSFNVSLLNFVWHGFHIPNDIPHRFAYIYTFFLLLISLKSIINIQHLTKKQILISSIITCSAILVLGIFFTPNKILMTIPFNIVLFIVYSFILAKKIGKITKKSLNILLCVLIVFEICLPYMNSFQTYDKTLLLKYDKDVQDAKELINDDTYYRMELLKNSTLNDSVLYGYNGISSFSSLNYQKIAHLQKYMGLGSNALNTTLYTSQTPIYNMIFGINYIIDNDNVENSPQDTNYFEKIGETTNKYNVYKNNFATGIGFSTIGDISQENIWNYKTYSPFANQNNFIKFAANTENIFENINNYTTTSENVEVTYKTENNIDQIFKYKITDNSQKSNIIITTKIPEKGHYYAYITTSDFDVTYDGEKIETTPQSLRYSRIAIMDLGILDANDTFETTLSSTITTKPEGTFNFFVCKTNDAEILNCYDTIKENGIMKVVNHSNDRIETTINTKTGYVFTTIPYDKNIKVTIDGVEASAEQIYPFADSLIAIKTTKGEHSIIFEYQPQGLLIGLSISASTLLSLIACQFIKKRKEKSNVV